MSPPSDPSARGAASSAGRGSAAWDPAAWLDARLERRLDPGQREWLDARIAEIGAGVDGTRFAGVLALASRYSPRDALAPGADERAEAARGIPGWNPARWRTLDAVRARLVLARSDLESDTFVRDLDDAFKYGDQGELRALYRTLCLLPGGERFRWRAGEGCRTNIVPVFEAVACDTPYPVSHFDDLAWNQLVIKAIFIGAPLWRVYGLDGRLSEDLARMALDLVDERRSAGRAIQPELWLCLGAHGGERALASLEAELEGSDTLGQRAALLALARAGRTERVTELADTLAEPDLAAEARAALEECGQERFRDLRPDEAS